MIGGMKVRTRGAPEPLPMLTTEGLRHVPAVPIAAAQRARAFPEAEPPARDCYDPDEGFTLGSEANERHFHMPKPLAVPDGYVLACIIQHPRSGAPTAEVTWFPEGTKEWRPEAEVSSWRLSDAPEARRRALSILTDAGFRPDTIGAWIVPRGAGKQRRWVAVHKTADDDLVGPPPTPDGPPAFIYLGDVSAPRIQFNDRPRVSNLFEFFAKHGGIGGNVEWAVGVVTLCRKMIQACPAGIGEEQALLRGHPAGRELKMFLNSQWEVQRRTRLDKQRNKKPVPDYILKLLVALREEIVSGKPGLVTRLNRHATGWFCQDESGAVESIQSYVLAKALIAEAYERLGVRALLAEADQARKEAAGRRLSAAAAAEAVADIAEMDEEARRHRHKPDALDDLARKQLKALIHEDDDRDDDRVTPSHHWLAKQIQRAIAETNLLQRSPERRADETAA
jgi:hypothetical protein